MNFLLNIQQPKRSQKQTSSFHHLGPGAAIIAVTQMTK